MNNILHQFINRCHNHQAWGWAYTWASYVELLMWKTVFSQVYSRKFSEFAFETCMYIVIVKQILRGNCNRLNSNGKSFGIKRVRHTNTVSSCLHIVKIVISTILRCKALTFSRVPSHSLGGFPYKIIRMFTRRTSLFEWFRVVIYTPLTPNRFFPRSNTAATRSYVVR